MRRYAFRNLVLALLCSPVLVAQFNRSTVTGIVTDPTGAVVVGAKITAVAQETKMTFNTTTTATGNYTLPALDIGRYRLEAEAPGFKRAFRDDVQLSSGATVRIDFVLEVGQVAEQIEVTARSTALETESTRVATNLTTKLVEDLPLVVAGQIRNVFNLAVIAPEAKQTGNFRIGGGQEAGWEMSMDGTSVTSASTNYQYERAPISSVPVDAIAEFNVESSGMKAEYGRAMGVISFATKAGGNDFHGNAFEYLRNNAADARGFFAQSAPVLKQHDFGFTAGGPVYIPKVYDGRNKSFFFVSYEGFRNREGNTPGYYTVPNAEMYEGDFSAYQKVIGGKMTMMQLYDPASTTLNPDGKTYSRVPFAGNQIPKTRFSSVASKYISFRNPSMVPNVPGAGITNNYFRDRGTNITPWNKYSIRGDHQLNTSNRFSFLYTNGTKKDGFGADGPKGLPEPYWTGSNWSRKNSAGRFSWDRTISARILNSLRVSYQREAGDLETLNSREGLNWAQKLGLKNTPGPDRGLPPLTFSGYSQWSMAQWGYDRGRDTNISNDLTIVTGSHTLKAGFFFSHDEWWGGGQHRPNGSFDFNIAPTAIPGDNSSNTGNAFASFLLGYAYQWGLETPRGVIQTWDYYGGFLQDDWRITRNLTLNLGLRYEYTGPIGGGAVLDMKDWSDFSSYGEPQGFMNFDPSVKNPMLGGILGATVFTGNCAECTAGEHPFDSWKKAWSPRFGLSYQPRTGTVIRAYAGKSYGAVKTTGGSTHFQGLILNSTFDNSSLPAHTYFQLDDGLPHWDPPPFRSPIVDLGGTTYYWQRTDSGRPPEFYTWNLDIQQQLPGNFVASAGYTGTTGVHLSSYRLNLNQTDPKYFKQYGRDLLLADINSPAARAAGIPVPYAGFKGSVAQALKPFPQWGDVNTGGSSVGERNGHSSYHAMIVKLDKRYSSGLTLLSSYVLSKMFSDSETTAAPGRNVLDHYNRRLDKGLSSNDQTHMFRNAFTYELPFGKGKQFALDGVSDKLLGGWGIAGFLEYGSGTPMNVGPGFSPIPGGMGNRVWITSYDNWRAPVAGDEFDPFRDVWWNKDVFQRAADGRALTQAELYAGIGNAAKSNPKARSPWYLTENVSLSKDVSVTERVRATLRFEAFNLFNRVRWGGPSSTITASNFGQIRSQGNDPRRMQFGAKVTF